MKHKIEHRKSIFRTGTNVFVHLEFTDTERRLIRDNNMEAVTIVEQEPTYQIVENDKGKKEKVEEDNNIYFRDLYRRRTSWHCDSVIEAQDFHKKIFEGLKQFNAYLEANMSPVEDTEGDLLDKPKDFSLEIIPDYMWSQHVYVLAESGGGKTQLLQTIYAKQMEQTQKPGFIVLDSQGQMLHIIKARFPNAIMIDPVVNPISLDLFNPGLFDASTTYTIIDTFKYLFEAGQQPLTGRQQTAFTYGIALMLLGYPKAFGRTASIEDFEEYLIGRKKGMELPPSAHKAADTMQEEMRNWYFNQYAGFQSTHGEILQRLNNICGPYTPLRPLFKKQHDTINLYDAIENGRTILVNTNYEKLGRYASSFFGRFFLKLLDKNIAHRSVRSPQVILMIDEVQEYLDGAVITPFTDQARKRNFSCIFAHQRLSQFADPSLRDALMGVGTLIATNVNDNDVREISNRFRVELDQVRAWRPQYRKEGHPAYADFGYFIKGKHQADSFRLKYGQLEDLPKRPSRVNEERQQADGERAQSHPSSDAPIDDSKYDERFDLEETITVSPTKAKAGYVHTVKCPNGQTQTISIDHQTKDGTRFCFKGMSHIRRPDGRKGNFWVQVNIPHPAQEDVEDF
ncbi:hypothetical protein UNPF46_30745 [Bradyrhizobium sp. UNPF46]|uniref:hypothetical protein n=1 Tax=Bradyrhizobium sp. UNPF46 TaxID=1141168 RepID=UPI00114D67EE|nr:hypothetical protein [Bradyrhizobium sp. UNPF46]TQF27442.1 hypothetical protein UNPF46_30745 [Bradyrhizobium sp. UNPF46]